MKKKGEGTTSEPVQAPPLLLDWNNQVISLPEKHENPCVTLYGRGKEGVICKTCEHLLRLRYHDKVYLKCELREITHGAGSDHRAGWQSCAKYVEDKEGDKEIA